MFYCINYMGRPQAESFHPQDPPLTITIKIPTSVDRKVKRIEQESKQTGNRKCKQDIYRRALEEAFKTVRPL